LINVGASLALVLMVGTAPLWPSLLAWLGALWIVLLYRAIDHAFIYPARRARGRHGGDIARVVTGTLATAAVWGSFSPILFPVLDTPAMCAALVVITAIAAGAVAPLAASMVAGAGFCILLLLPAIFMVFRSPLHSAGLLGGVYILVLAGLLLSGRRMHRSLVKSLVVMHVNAGLVEAAEDQRRETEIINAKLSAAQIALHDANQSLERRIEARTAELEREISERRAYAGALARLASTDPLTSLRNRSNFAERLGCMLAAAEQAGRECAVLFLDLDNFKQINDARGHATGDHVLQGVSQALSKHVGERAEIARWGGDEFVLAMPIDPGSDAALTLSHDLRRVLAEPLQAGLEIVRVDVTIGIAIFPEHGRTQDELIRAADVAMYEAKRAGRGRVTLFDRSLAKGMHERHLLEQALREAVDRGELSLVYQPIVSARTGRCDAFEALVRWHHPTRGLIGPAHFIPVAEQSGQINQIGRFVLKEACRAAALWPPSIGPDDSVVWEPPAVTVNVSVAQVLSGTLLSDVEAALLGSGLPATRLQVEITESMFVADHVRVTPVFDALRRRGIRILLDDFGTGFSSLAYLGKLPIDVIKIDQSFVRGAERDGFAIINAILSIARALSLQVTAEGVETGLQRSVLASIGVERLQGYLIARPMPGENVAGWLADHGNALQAPQAAVA
jgi:diguanylate cyclase (GGDEF)-like protein